MNNRTPKKFFLEKIKIGIKKRRTLCWVQSYWKKTENVCPKKVWHRKLKPLIVKSEKFTYSWLLCYNFFKCILCQIFLTDLKSTKSSAFFYTYLDFFQEYLFLGSFQYFLETLELNSTVMGQNMAKCSVINRSYHFILNLWQL